jgi:zinc transport system permease protein
MLLREAAMEWINSLINAIADWFPNIPFLNFPPNLYAALAILLAGLICGGMGGLVVGNRMAFFSDALAHCAFAGIAFGFFVCVLAQVPDEHFREWVTVAMVAFGVVIGVLIAWVRDRTGLASDTVIGVFFAFAVGIGAVSSKLIAQRRRLPGIESFIFGDPLSVQPIDLVALLVLLGAIAVFLVRYYNEMILTSVHPSLAMSRRVPVAMLRYTLIILLALIVNLCLQIVGVLLINGLLIVPAAAAANLSRNLRQHFWWTLGLTVGCGALGQFLSWEINVRYPGSTGIGGMIVVLVSLSFFLSMAVRPLLHGRLARA